MTSASKHDDWRKDHPVTEPVKVVRSEVRAMLKETAPLPVHMAQEEQKVWAVLQKLDDPDWETRVAAAHELGEMDHLPIWKIVEVLRKEQDESVRETLIRVLGKLESQMPVQAIVSLLYEDESWLVREAAAWAIGELGDQAPIKYLIRSLRCDPDEYVRIAAARSLGHIGKQEAEQPLLEALLDADADVREAASWALQQLDEETRGMVRKPPRSDLIIPWIEIATSSSAGAGWQQIEREDALFVLTDFIRDKKGSVRHQLLSTPHGQTLLLYCSYQQVGRSSIHETFMQTLEEGSLVKSLDTIWSEQDEAIRSALAQVVKAYEERPWEELLVVSFALSHPTRGTGPACAPLRVIVAGMSYTQMKQAETSLLGQIVTTWSRAIEEPLVCQHPHDLLDLTIWCQPRMPLTISQGSTP